MNKLQWVSSYGILLQPNWVTVGWLVHQLGSSGLQLPSGCRAFVLGSWVWVSFEEANEKYKAYRLIQNKSNSIVPRCWGSQSKEPIDMYIIMYIYIYMYLSKRHFYMIFFQKLLGLITETSWRVMQCCHNLLTLSCWPKDIWKRTAWSVAEVRLAIEGWCHHPL